MSKKKFSIVEALRFAFSTVIDNILFFLSIEGIIVVLFIFAALLIFGIIYFFWSSELLLLCKQLQIPCDPSAFKSIIDSTVATLSEQNPTAVTQDTADIYKYFATSFAIVLFIGAIFLGILYRFFMIGMVRISLDFYDYQTSGIKRLFSSILLTLKAFIASILYNFMVCLGTLFFIIPGIILAIRYGFYQQVLVDKKVGILESLKMSAQITKGAKWSIFGINLIFGLINLGAFITFGLLYLISIPALFLAQAYIYRKLLVLPVKTENNHKEL